MRILLVTLILIPWLPSRAAMGPMPLRLPSPLQLAMVNADEAEDTLFHELYRSLVALEKIDSQQDSYDCMGVVIHENFILTAGHCTRSAERVNIRYFTARGDLLQGTVVSVRSQQVDHHPYSRISPPKVHKGNREDVGLVYVENPPVGAVPLTFVRGSWNPVEEDATLYVLSFSRESRKTTPRAFKDFRYVELERVVRIARGKHFVARVKQGIASDYRTAICKGDSGAPVVAVNTHGDIRLVGTIVGGSSQDNAVAAVIGGKRLRLNDFRCGEIAEFYNGSLVVPTLENWMSRLSGKPADLRVDHDFRPIR